MTDYNGSNGHESRTAETEFALRPLRISKRESTANPANPANPPPPANSRRKSSGPDEFVCRPMRLSSNSLQGKKDKRAESRESFLETQSLDSREKRSSRSNRSSISIPESSTSQSRQLSIPETAATSQSRRSSIQVKNLPILQSSRPPQHSSHSDDMIFAVCLVDFHHVHGPEVSWWRSNYQEPANESLFKNLPFQALPDGSHLFEETFSNFNLVYDLNAGVSLDNSADIEAYKGNPNHLETFFGCSCVRQIKATELSEEELSRNKAITRSIVQKAVVVISRRQPIFTKIKEKLSIITHSFFQQPSFDNYDLLESLFDNLNDAFKLDDIRDSVSPPTPSTASVQEQLKTERYEDQEEFFVNLNLKEHLAQFKNDLLTIFKAVLLEKKVLIYSNHNLELLTQFQNSIIALIPNLMNSLELSGCPLCDFSEKNAPLSKPSSLKTNDRMSMLRFFGLPLQTFNTKGSFWNPYLPLQQMEELSTESYMVGCSNLLMVNQSAKFGVDVLVNLDTSSISYPRGKPEELRLSTLDKKFVSVLGSSQKRKDLFMGGDDYIRYQFEDYTRSMLASVRLMQYMERFKMAPPGFEDDKYASSYKAFNEHFIAKWRTTKNFQVWTATCDEFVFNFAEPLHVAAEMVDANAVGGFLSSFKKMPQPSMANLTEDANHFPHAQKPRKFIVDNEEDQNEPKKSPKSGWSWGFRR